MWGSGREKEGATTLSPEFSEGQNEGILSPWFTGKGRLTQSGPGAEVTQLELDSES